MRIIDRPPFLKSGCSVSQLYVSAIIKAPPSQAPTREVEIEDEIPKGEG